MAAVKHHIACILFVALFSLPGFAQKDTVYHPRAGWHLKANARALILQPGLSLEYFFNQQFSLETGASYFWTGRKIYGDDGISRWGVVFFGFGPSKGHDLFADLNFHFSNGFYLGAGYAYRHSFFTGSKQSIEVNSDTYQNFRQSETAYSNCLRVTCGYVGNKKRAYQFNPYLTLMFGQSRLNLGIDTVDANNYAHYNPVVFPLHEHRVMSCFFMEIGVKICFGLSRRKPEEEYR